MSNIIEADSLECQICLEEFYSNENLAPICLECGHTFCKRCVHQMSETKSLNCPIDKKSIALSSDSIYGMENFIIKKTIALMNCLEINVKPFCKLSLFHCSKCNLFISNFVKDIHSSVDHKVISIATYTSKWFDYISNNISLKTITPNVMMYIIAYLFQSAYILQAKQFAVKEILSLNNKTFTFYGEHYARTESNKRFYNILKSILSENNTEYSNYNIKKGIVIGSSLQIMHGYFLVSGARPYSVIKGIGVLNYIDVNFFGIVSFMPQPQHSGFAFNYGILRQSGTFCMGTFNNDNYEFPTYSFVSGEEIINALQRTYVIRKPYLNDLTEETVEPFDENAENNVYYKVIKNTIHFKSTATKIPKCEVKYTFNQPMVYDQDLLEVEINYEDSDIELEKKEKVKLTPFANNDFLSKIVIQPLKGTSFDNDYLKHKIGDCYIKLVYKTISLIMFFVKENESLTHSHIILTNEIPSNDNYCGYDIKLTPNEVTFYLNSLVNFTLEGALRDNPILINLLHSLFDIKLANCLVFYQLFTPKTPLRLSNSLYYSFNIPEGTITCNYNNVFKKNKVIRCQELKEMTIKQLIPNVYSSESFEDIFKELEFIDNLPPFKKPLRKSCTIKCSGCMII